MSTEALQNRMKAMIVNAEKVLMLADFEKLRVVTLSALGSMVVRRQNPAAAANQLEAVVRNLRDVRRWLAPQVTALNVECSPIQPQSLLSAPYSQRPVVQPPPTSFALAQACYRPASDTATGSNQASA